MEPNDVYAGREQTLVKHEVLRAYLGRFAPIILSSTWKSVTYVDCFSGPWNARTEDFRDTSFGIALDELRKARSVQHAKGRSVDLRCFFLERDKHSYARLRAFAESIVDIEIETRNAELEESVSTITDFSKRGGNQNFTFVFIDPTGWTGFAMNTIAPLLELNPGEVLINLMTKDVRRFITSPEKETQESFERLFGRRRVKERVVGTKGLDRDDVVVEEYGRSVRETGRYRYVCAAIVLHPSQDRTHFHLIYATRHRRGVEAFKDAEKKAMELQETARAAAEERMRREATGMASLFDESSMHNPEHYAELRSRYLARSRMLVRQLLESGGQVPYERLWDAALAQPMTWESDLKLWLQQWQGEGRVSHQGWKPRQKVPHVDQGNVVVWT